MHPAPTPQDPTRRFSSRVADYVRYRPSYPPQLIDALRRAGALPDGAVVADIGSGTGLLTRLFLDAGHPVVGIEPNPDMRAAGEHELRAAPNFTSLDATAEAATLPAASIDLITAGQAFHWFNRPKTRAEFQRILKPAGHVALIWNQRLTDTTPFLAAYETLLQRFSTDYAQVDHRQMTPAIIAAFFAPFPPTLLTFPNQQVFDFPALRGRLLSSSYAPPPGHPNHQPMLEELARLFDRFQQNNAVTFEYTTELHLARLH